MNGHYTDEFMTSCYALLKSCKQAIFTCTDLETCKRTGSDPCHEKLPAMGSCRLLIEACQDFTQRAKIHLNNCDIAECSKLVKNTMNLSNTTITQAQACIDECMNNGKNCANFCQSTARTCEELTEKLNKLAPTV